MDLQAEKTNIAEVLAKLAGSNFLHKYPRALQSVQALQRDMAGDFYTVVVVGEFKRGKSTLVNALLGKEILPMNVLPETATINAIMYEERPRLSVMQRDGKEVVGEASREFLRRYSAGAEGSEAEKVSYIKIGYPCEMLKNRIVLVDTPGVSDLNEHRSEVTYKFLPQANAVLFVLDANSPLKKTEHDFIVDKLLPLGITNILFLVNKYDAVDEEEEEDFLPTVKRRIMNAFRTEEGDAALQEISILPVSAKWALEGQEKQNEKMLRLSGMPAVQEKIRDMLSEGRIEREKVEGYRNRLCRLLMVLEREMERERQMRSAGATELAEAAEVLRQALAEKSGQQEKLEAYVKSAKAKIFAMADKSLQYFHGRLREAVLESVEQYGNQDFKYFVETVVPRQVQKNIDSWFTAYVPHVEELLGVMELELARGLSSNFEQQVKLQAEKKGSFSGANFGLHLEVDDLSQTANKVNALTGIGAIAVSSMLTPFLVPILSTWGRSTLFKNMLSKKLEAAKAEALPQLEGELPKAVMALMKQVHDYVDRRSEDILKNTEEAYETLLEEMRSRVEMQMAEKGREEESLHREMAELSGHLQEIQAYLEKFQSEEAVK